MVCNSVICGGTFDHFHKGHEKFLEHALSLANHVVVGLTSDEYVRNLKSKSKNSQTIENYEIRSKSLQKFFLRKGISEEVSVIEINDFFGPTLSSDLKIDGILVSEETKKGADLINSKRRELSLNSLEVFVVPHEIAEDGKNISSERIRCGEINREGRLYIKRSWLKDGLTLPNELREEFRKPFGKIFQKIKDICINKSSFIVTVGDATSKLFNENHIKLNASIIDFRIAREDRFSSISELGFSEKTEDIVVNNPAGRISSDIFLAIPKIFELSSENVIVLKVIGEEDLAVLPLILYAPLGANIYYGQPNEGIVEVVVSEKLKEDAYNLASKLKPI